MRRPHQTLLLICFLNACTHAPTHKTTAPLPPNQVTPTIDLADGITEQALHAYVGRTVIVRGEWHNAGKEGPYIIGGQQKTAPEIYVLESGGDLSKLNALYTVAHEESPAQVSGILRYSPGSVAPPSADPPMAATTQGAPPMFYFDLNDATVQFPPR